jgi:hypothetical protein
MIDGNFTKFFFVQLYEHDRRLYKITVYCEGVVQRSRQKKRPVHDNPENIEMRIFAK